MDPNLEGGGGGSGGGPAGPPVAVARGTAINKVSNTQITLSVTVATSSAALMLSLGYDSGLATVSSMTWGAKTFTQIGPTQASANLNQEQWAALNCSAGTNTLTVNFSAAVVEKAFTVFEVTNLLSLDKQVNAGGISTSPDSGNTATTTQASEFLWGTVVTNGPVEDAAGTWQASFTTGQRNGTTGGVDNTNVTVSEGYRLVSATGAYSASKLGITSRDWGALISTWKTA